MTADTEMIVKLAFEKLVEVSQEQIALQTQQVEALRGINERLDRVSLEHGNAVRDSRIHVEQVLTAKLSASEVWWRRAFVGFGVLVALASLVGNVFERIIGLVK